MNRFRSEKPRAYDVARVRVFLDHWEFARSWQRSIAGLTGRKITPHADRRAQIETDTVRWDKLPEAIIDRLDSMEYISETPKELRSIDVYASISTSNGVEEQKLKKWLRSYLDELPGYTVYQSDRRKDRPEYCKNKDCGRKLEPEVEKGLKTKVACDILSLAVKDLYDIGVLVMDDPELIPSILCVQEVLDKQIVHVGLKDSGMQVRSAAWGHVLLEDILPEIFPHDEWRQLFLSARAVA